MKNENQFEDLHSNSNEVDNIAKDFFLILLVVFILVVIITPPATEALQMNLPSMSQDAKPFISENENHDMEIRVTKEGHLFLYEEEIECLDSLKKKIIDIKTSPDSTSLSIHLYADKDTPYQLIIDVLGILNSLDLHSVYLHGVKEGQQ